jgi:hypothetical protein
MPDLPPESALFIVLHYVNQLTMKKPSYIIRFFLAAIIFSQFSLPVFAWSEHPMMARPALKTSLNGMKLTLWQPKA